ncbi:MAG: extracellular solute-binding protein, partial [Clostridia bacterium]|nr:extracellular solute-binding protein [Clostridia bacterium]
MMKKILSITLAIALILTSMLGLTASASEFDVGYDGSEVTIRFYHTMGSNLTTVLDAYITEFNAIYPNIKVEYTSVGGYDDVRDQISKEIPEGIQPNIAYCYQDHVAMYNLAMAVQPLDELIDSPTVGLTAEQKADFIPGYYAEGAQFADGKMYTLPMSKSTEVLYYNKTFFDANNI